jgi:UDP-GlcNAc3NAcA epimerase
LIDPVRYLDMVTLTASARFVLTDSGGLRQEAYWLAVPCITLRDDTEWVETVDSGWNTLAGADTDKIVHAVRTFVQPDFIRRRKRGRSMRRSARV